MVALGLLEHQDLLDLLDLPALACQVLLELLAQLDITGHPDLMEHPD